MHHLINVPVADLRKEPVKAINGYQKDPLQETQLLYGEKVLVKEHKKSGWSHIECVEQHKWQEGSGWSGYPGWVQTSHLSSESHENPSDLAVNVLWAEIYPCVEKGNQHMLKIPFGSYLKALERTGSYWKVVLSDGREGLISASSVVSLADRRSLSMETFRAGILNSAKAFLGMPYLWGGRSPFCQETAYPSTSVDFSGLANLTYRANGVIIPRDAHDQYLFSKKIEKGELGLGDLVFLSKNGRMTHVMLFAGGEWLVEASLEPKCVRLISFVEKMGKPLGEIAAGEELHGGAVFFGTVL